ncbi:hypothetical protein AOLI_G00154810 [Acnodon oligacanthus]
MSALKHDRKLVPEPDGVTGQELHHKSTQGELKAGFGTQQGAGIYMTHRGMFSSNVLVKQQSIPVLGKAMEFEEWLNVPLNESFRAS